MKNKLVSLLLALILTLGSGCAMAESHPLNMGVATDSITFIPYENNSTLDYYVINSVYDCLMYASSTFEPLEPRIVKSYELSEDGLTLTMTLQEGITFHNGEAVTAEDVAGTIKLYAASPYREEMTMLVADAVAADESTVVVTFNEANAFGLWKVMSVRVMNVDAFNADPDGYTRMPIGCGPYEIVSNESGAGVTLKAYEQYYRGEAAISEPVFQN